MLTRVGEEKGAWTVVYPPYDVKEFFGRPGYVRVKGTIDGFAVKGMNLMPIGEKWGPTTHWLPIKESIRKAIGKKEGSTVNVVLVLDEDALTIPEDLAATLELSPIAKAFFESLTQSQKSYFVKSIIEAKTDETRYLRIEKCIEKLEARKKFYDL